MEGTRHSDLDTGERQGLDLVGVARSMAGARHSDLDAGERKGLDRRELLDPWQGLDIQISMLATGRGSTWWRSTGGKGSIHGRDSIHSRDSAF